MAAAADGPPLLQDLGAAACVGTLRDGALAAAGFGRRVLAQTNVRGRARRGAHTLSDEKSRFKMQDGHDAEGHANDFERDRGLLCARVRRRRKARGRGRRRQRRRAVCLFKVKLLKTAILTSTHFLSQYIMESPSAGGFVAVL